MAREYDPFKTYRPHLEYCPKCIATAEHLNHVNFPIYFFEPTTRKCWNNCGTDVRCLNINGNEREIIMRATDWNVQELERMAALKETNPTAFRKQLKEWSSIPKVNKYLNGCVFVARCNWCIEHDIVDPKYRAYFCFDNYHKSSLNPIEKCPTCGRELSILNVTCEEMIEMGCFLAPGDVSFLNEMLKLRDEDINKYYWKLGTMQAKRFGIRYPDEPIPIWDLTLRIPVAIIMLLKTIFFTWPHSFWAWFALIVVIAKLGS